MTRTIDFDQFRAEQKEEPIDFIIGKEHYSLPPSLPASMAVDMMRIQAMMEDEEEIPNDTMIEFGKSLFGDIIWEELIKKHRITVAEISPLMEKVLEQYTDVPKEESSTGSETSESEVSSSTSSPTGRGSKRTSSASTPSTSRKS